MIAGLLNLLPIHSLHGFLTVISPQTLKPSEYLSFCILDSFNHLNYFDFIIFELIVG